MAFPTTTRHPLPQVLFQHIFFLRFSCFISRVARLDDLCSSARVPVNTAVSPWSRSTTLLCGSGHYPGSSELVLPNLHRTCHPEIVLKALIILVAAGVWKEFLGNPCLCQVHIWFPWREERIVVVNFGNRKKRNAGICLSLLRFDHTLMQWRTEVTFRFLFYL